MNEEEFDDDLNEVMELISGNNSTDTFWSATWDICYTIFVIIAVSASIASAIGIAVWTFRAVFWAMGLSEVF